MQARHFDPTWGQTTVAIGLGARQMQGFLFSPSLSADALCERYAGKNSP